ncbi:MAG: PAS domain S-box protein [Cyclobacteriaceae bacterium]
MDKGKLNDIFNETSEPIVIFNAQGRIIYTNQAAYQLLRYEAEGKSIFQLLEQSVHAALQEFISQPSTRQSSFLQKECLLIDNRQVYIPATLMLSAIRYEQAYIYMMVLEYAQPAEEELRNDQYKLLADHTPALVSLYDASLNCLYVNLSSADIYGYSPTEYARLGGFLSLIPEEEKAQLTQLMAQDTLHKTILKTYTYQASHRDGHLIWVQNIVRRIYDREGALYHLISYEHDISKEVQQSVRMHEARYMPDALLLLDPQWRISYASAEARSILQNSEPEGQSIYDFVVPSEHKQVEEEQLSQLSRGIISSRRLLRLGSAAQPQRCWCTFNKFFDEEGMLLYVVLRLQQDTEVQTPHEASATEYFRLVMDSLDEIACLTDRQLKLQYHNEQVEHHLGYKKQELAGKPLDELLHPESRKLLEQKLQEAEGGLPVEMSARLLTKADGYQPYQLRLRRLDDKLRKEEAFFMLLLRPVPASVLSLSESLPYLMEAFAMVELPSGKILQVNQSFEQQYAQEQTIDLLFKEEQDSRNFRQVLENPDVSFYSAEVEMAGKDGTSIQAKVSLSSIRQAGNAIGLLHISDLTKRQKQQDEIKAAELRLSEKDEFIAMLSHEVRTPLNVILGMVHLLLERNPRQDQLKLLETLKFSGESLHALVTNILDFNRLDTSEVEVEIKDFNLKEFVQRIKQAYRSLANNKGLIFRTLIEDDLPELLKGDVHRLGQILNNLLSNAVKFTSQGQVVLSIYVEKVEPSAFQLLFEVSDTGTGIPEEMWQKVFEPYQQADKNIYTTYGGTGLGLSIVKRLVDRLEGTISLESKEGQGTTFRVRLPFKRVNSEKEASQQTSQNFIHQFQSLRGLRVLYVEDVIPNQFLMEGLCDTWSVELDTALNGLEALEKVKNNQYDLILMDIQMPEMDGYETAGEIRKLQDPHYRNVPIFALSASISERTQARIRETGMNDYIAKPINPHDLHQKLSTVFKERAREETLTEESTEEASSSAVDVSVRLDEADFEELRTLYIDDTAGYVKILHQILKLTEESAVTIEIALKRGEENIFRSSGHKIMSYVRLLHLDELQTLLESIKHDFGIISQSPDPLIQELRLRFDYLIKQLKLETEKYAS